MLAHCRKNTTNGTRNHVANFAIMTFNYYGSIAEQQSNKDIHVVHQNSQRTFIQNITCVRDRDAARLKACFP